MKIRKMLTDMNYKWIIIASINRYLPVYASYNNPNDFLSVNILRNIKKFYLISFASERCLLNERLKTHICF